jgi:hypothetical protein
VTADAEYAIREQDPGFIERFHGSVVFFEGTIGEQIQSYAWNQEQQADEILGWGNESSNGNKEMQQNDGDQGNEEVGSWHDFLGHDANLRISDYDDTL